jgi:Domain of unkown function (DUF1775)
VFVSVQPIAGWEVATTTRKLATPIGGDDGSVSDVVDTITWTATETRRSRQVSSSCSGFSAGQRPTDVTELTFPAIETYSSGEDVAWISTPGGAEPEHPAPTVQLTAASGGEDTSAIITPAASSDDDGDSNTLAVALIIGGVGLVAAITALALGRRRPAAARRGRSSKTRRVTSVPPGLEGMTAWHTSYDSGGRRLDAFMARPDGSGPHPGVVFHHGSNGLMAAAQHGLQTLVDAGYACSHPSGEATTATLARTGRTSCRHRGEAPRWGPSSSPR